LGVEEINDELRLFRFVRNVLPDYLYEAVPLGKRKSRAAMGWGWRQDGLRTVASRE
jgi:hypothetical protein